MKVWRGFTLVLWVSLLTLCLSGFLFNLAAQRSLLDPQVAKAQLAKGSFYDTLRDDVLAPQVTSALNERFPSNKLIDDETVQGILARVLPKNTLQKRVEPVLDLMYRWLDSKEPEVTFAVSLEDKRDSFYKAAETTLQKKIAALPECDSYAYPPEDALLYKLCRPSYVTASEATQAAMGSLRASSFPLGTVTQDSISIAGKGKQVFGSIPTYLNLLWVINLIGIAVGLFLIIILLATRKLTGVIAIGCSALLAGVVLWVLSTIFSTIPVPDAEGFTAIVKSIKDSLIPSFTTLLTRYGFFSLLGGLVLIVIGGVFKWRQRGAAG